VHFAGEGRAFGHHLLAAAAAAAAAEAPSHASQPAGSPLGEAAEEDLSMFEYHGGHIPDVQSPVVREGSAFSHSSPRDWHIKAGMTDSYIQRSRSSASLWHCEYEHSSSQCYAVCLQ
jgi:hypothetical protein